MSSKHEDEEELLPLQGHDFSFLIENSHYSDAAYFLHCRDSSDTNIIIEVRKKFPHDYWVFKLFGLLISSGNRRRTIFALCQYTSDITLMMNNTILALIKLKEVADAFAARFCIQLSRRVVGGRTKYDQT